MEQFSFGNNSNLGDIPPIVNASEHHMALLFMVDTSGSMGATLNDEEGRAIVPIDELNNALNRFKDQVCTDEHTKDILDVAIIEFNNDYRVVQEFTPVEFMQPINLEANGQTYMGGALNCAIEMVTERSRFYRRAGAEPYKPWIVLISDGEPFDDVNQLASKINQLSEEGKLAFWSLAVPGANLAVLHQLSGRRVLTLKNYDFKGFLDWTTKSMRAVSVSSPGEKVKAEALPNTVTIDDLM